MTLTPLVIVPPQRVTTKQAVRTRRVVVVGQGYVGLPLAMSAVDAGFDVLGLDVDERRVDALCGGLSFVEDVPDARLRDALHSGRYLATVDGTALSGFDVAVITVPTPLRDGAPDLTYVDLAGRAIAPHIRPGCVVILESTTYPGTTERLLRPLLETGSRLTAGVDFALGFSPERIDPGNPIWGFGNTPKVVSGLTPNCLESVRSFYSELVDTVVSVSDCATAELAKLLENTFRAVNIALVNELAMHAGELGVDVWEAIDAAATKPFGFMKFTPGPGVGGHCLPIDPLYLSWEVQRSLGQRFRMVELASDVNEGMPAHVVNRLMLGLNERAKALKGAKVLLLGLTYKRNTSDSRESPAMHVAESLLRHGADVRAVDAHVAARDIDPRITLTDATRSELAAADAVVLLVDHGGVDYDLVADSADYVFDAVARLDRSSPSVERL